MSSHDEDERGIPAAEAERRDPSPTPDPTSSPVLRRPVAPLSSPVSPVLPDMVRDFLIKYGFQQHPFVGRTVIVNDNRVEEAFKVLNK